MGTRNLTIVINKVGAVKVAQYGQWDGYPSGQGATVLNFCRNKEKLEKLKEKLDKCVFFQDKEYLKDWVQSYNSKIPTWENPTVEDTRSAEDIYWFNMLKTRDLGADILDNIITVDVTKLPKEHLGNIVLDNDISFGKDSLMCEYAYCINLQTNKLMCFVGFNKNKDAQHSLFEVTKDSNYYGCRLLKEYDLDNLPTVKEFIKELNTLEEVENE